MNSSMFCKMLMVAMGAALALSPVAAYAQTRPARDKIATSSPDEERERVDPVAVGAIAGVGFPRPLAVEGLVKLHDRIALGLEYGVMPEITVAEINTRLWSVAGDLRVFPFGGMLFAGLRGGRQHIGADTTVPVDGRDAVAAVNVDSWYLNPRVGILWTSKLGLTLGTEAGVQVPIGSRVSTNLPRGTSDTVVSVADALGKQVIPTLDLIRVGFVR